MVWYTCSTVQTHLSLLMTPCTAFKLWIMSWSISLKSLSPRSYYYHYSIRDQKPNKNNFKICVMWTWHDTIMGPEHACTTPTDYWRQVHTLTPRKAEDFGRATSHREYCCNPPDIVISGNEPSRDDVEFLHFFSGWQHSLGGWRGCLCPPRRYYISSCKTSQSHGRTTTSVTVE